MHTRQATFLPFCTLFLALLIHNAILRTHGAATPLYTMCSATSGNFSSLSPYATNLKTLTTYLTRTILPSGFKLSSAGRFPYSAYGLALCRGDVTGAPCKFCVADAAAQLRTACPTQKEAVIWFDNCLLHYSNANFLGKVDNQHKVYMWNTAVVPHDPKAFNKNVVDLLKRVVKKASGKPAMFATEEAKTKEWGKVYALAQCTRDLSAKDCKACLEAAVGEFPSCCDGKKGGRVLGGSCNFRYELYPFYKK